MPFDWHIWQGGHLSLKTPGFDPVVLDVYRETLPSLLVVKKKKDIFIFTKFLKRQIVLISFQTSIKSASPKLDFLINQNLKNKYILHSIFYINSDL